MTNPSGLERLAFMYCLTAIDHEEVERAKGGQLVFPKDDPYTADTLSARENWFEEEARKYDRFRQVVRVTLLCPPHDCVSLFSADEASLLSQLWDALASYGVGGYREVAGWEVQERTWPTLLNRSLVNGVQIPAWAKHDLTRRWPVIQLHDISQIYKSGASHYNRPLPKMEHVLRFWLGEDFPCESDLQIAASVYPQREELKHQTCQYVDGMCRAVARYIA